MLYRPVPSKLNQIAFGFSIKKSGPNHFSIRICAALPRKGIFGYSQSRGIEGWRHVKVSDRHTAIDYAHTLRDLSDVHFPDAAKIVLVQDNLNTHKPASLYQAFPAAEARRLVERFE